MGKILCDFFFAVPNVPKVLVQHSFHVACWYSKDKRIINFHSLLWLFVFISKVFHFMFNERTKKKHHRCDKYIFLRMKMRARVLLWNNNEFDLAKREPFVFSQRLLLIEVIQMKRYVNRVFKPKCHTQSKYHSQYHSQYRHRTQSGYSK